MTPTARPTFESDRILARLLTLHPKVIDLSLERLWRLLDRLGNPERRLPPVVHVAGTNGKGSVIAYLRAMLEAAGYRVHVYISPHLVRFHERIRLAGTLIDEAALSARLARCEAVNGDAPITFFEITTAAAFDAFADHPADILLLETGLGGRLDATNVIARPAATALTPISLDHQHYLGDTLAQIAFEKAGILKAGVPSIVGPQVKDALAVIREQAARRGAPLHVCGADWEVEATADGFVYRNGDHATGYPPPGLLGRHQFGNAGIALAVLDCLEGYSVDDRARRQGLAGVEWPARMQRLASGPLLDRLPAGAELWLDGGHNPDAGNVLETLFRDIQGRDPRPFHLIAGMLQVKDRQGFLRHFSGLAESAYAVPIEGEAASTPPDELARHGREAGLAMVPADDVESALGRIAAAHAGGPAPRVLIAGSLYLAGRVLRANDQMQP
ncbi:bifunctional folylpolyglutamate synthase/dihydrofolate synthase [Oceanibacterium hippocampi]|uniref:tetrahydrofolate synthase n=1 Tax=Oceanibacterium hippocampi TaxID=745714 RepID=A0A1Y5RQT4_9PROT|nr:folylpolyglutamate synthase/dihydrofolate synthase family protein [Oceanibacterium hippocampi]SLN22283.1 Bifunctional protein FolC [Oceanibacterium hippocampi]